MELIRLPMVPIWIQVGFFLLTLVCLLFIYRSTGLFNITNRGEILQLRRWLVYYPAAWLVLISAIASTGFFTDFSTIPPRIMPLLVVPIIYLIVLSRRPLFRRYLNGVPAHWLLLLQSFRIPVEILLWGLFITGWLPVQMTFEGLNWDILSGVFGLILGLYLMKRPQAPRWIGHVYNAVGMLLLLNIVTIALLSTPSPFRVFMEEPANRVVASFPIVFLPAYLVPLAYYLHIASWLKKP